ncbi:type I restriction enzyme HsdR N-terminal domain-containing protein [Desulfonatronospira sp.]|uniref:type I restriction enzyme HsdR N-terminal domain-containing protein n=1 Tax=Desulfonatronospira sp. TaxID=1962951 RepID=UPI0025BBDC6A|nr:type I restriction enzyme HsdR N-terminal domain-containing protein [Desulfonatronospira sp.]
MHEVSFDQIIKDYLTGEDLQMTTYEDIRQSLARILVEEKGYPHDNIIPRYELELDLTDRKYTIKIDFVVIFDNRPVLILGFCPGAVSTFITQYVSAGRLIPEGPASFAVITDSKDASLVRISDKKELCRGFHCIPTWDYLQTLYHECEHAIFSPERLEKEKRVAHAMFALSDGYCSDKCTPTTGKFQDRSRS